jgi:hypothetical protein
MAPIVKLGNCLLLDLDRLIIAALDMNRIIQ